MTRRLSHRDSRVNRADAATVRDLAHVLKCSSPAVWRALTGEVRGSAPRTPTVPVMVAANVLGMDADLLRRCLDGEDELLTPYLAARTLGTFPRLLKERVKVDPALAPDVELSRPTRRWSRRRCERLAAAGGDPELMEVLS